MTKHKSEDYKLTAVKYYLNQNKNQTKTCKIFRCSQRSLMRWIGKYQLNGNIRRKSRKYVVYKMRTEYVKFIRGELKKNKTLPVVTKATRFTQAELDAMTPSERMTLYNQGLI